MRNTARFGAGQSYIIGAGLQVALIYTPTWHRLADKAAENATPPEIPSSQLRKRRGCVPYLDFTG